MKATLSIEAHVEARRELDAAARLASADPLALIRTLWRKLKPEQRAEFLEEAHHAPEAAQREVER